MSNKRRHPRQERHVYVRGVRREQPDLRRLARVLIEFARAEAEARAAAEHEASKAKTEVDEQKPSSPETGEAA